MEESDTDNFEKIKEIIRKDYPHIQYKERNEKVVIQFDTQTGPLIATFNKPWVLQTLLETFEGFQKIHFPGIKTSILFRDNLYAFGRTINPKHTTPFAERFTLHTEQSEFETIILETQGLGSIISFILEGNLSYDDYKKSYSKFMPEYTTRWFGGADLGWDASHLLLLLNCTDIDIPPGLPLELLLYTRWDSMFIIRPSKITNESQEFLKSTSDSILDFLCFEYYKTHNVLLEVPNLRKFSWHPDPVDWSSVVPTEKEPCIKDSKFRRVDPILMEHLKVAEHSNIPSFQFLSFYHILEHFYDTVALQILIDEIQKTLEFPDISKRSNWYARLIASDISYRNPNSLHENIKLRGVLKKFVPFLIKDQFSDELREHINHSTRFEDGLILDSVRMTNPEDFFSDLANRIYKLRCAIVHSNPHYDREQSHVGLSDENMKLVSTEVELLRILVLEIILRSNT